MNPFQLFQFVQFQPPTLVQSGAGCCCAPMKCCCGVASFSCCILPAPSPAFQLLPLVNAFPASAFNGVAPLIGLL